MEWLQRKLGYAGLFVVEPMRRSGGLEMLWKEDSQATLTGYSRNHIDIQVRGEDNTVWRLTGLYGESNRSQRHKTWDLLRNLARDSNLP